MQTIKVRHLVDEDLMGVACLWHDSWVSTGLSKPSDPSVEQYEDRLSTEGRQMWSIQVAVAEDDILGFMAYQKQPSSLRQLFVKPTMKRLGVGTLLLGKAKQDMPNGFWLRTNADNNAARRFYEVQGLRFDGEAVHPTFGHKMARYLWSPAIAD